MKKINLLLALAVLCAVVISGGCQPWEKKYNTCVQEKENLEGLFESSQQSLQQCDAERARLAQQIASLNQQLRDAQASQASKPVETGLEAEGGVYDPSKGTITVPLASDVLFDSGNATLKSEPKAKLNRIAGIINQRYSGKEVWVVGHTDTDPIRKSKWKDNWELSAQRSLAVTRYLIGQGIPAKQLAAAGRGEFHPIGSRKADNRRVEVIVHMY
ncbi:MAG: OmpA family protein [Sedimentisphaerales bacterium]|nr:OmpA family protein [Sedimentisphaerales bacterium]